MILRRFMHDRKLPSVTGKVVPILKKIGTKEFWRLKIGIGKPVHKDDVISYVLGKPSPDDKKQILDGIKNIIQNSQDLMNGSYRNFMNKLNGDNSGI